MAEILGRQGTRKKQGIKREVATAFGLVLLAFLVFLGYLFPGLSSLFVIDTNMQIVIFIAFVIVVLGFITIWKIVDSVVRISREAKRIADGDFTRKIKIYRGAELGELGEALNRMTKRIKDNMEELKTFSEQTEAINVEINKRILVLSSLLQISNLISQNAPLDKIIDLSIEKCLTSGQMDVGCLILYDRDTAEYRIKSWHGSRGKEAEETTPENSTIKHDQGLLGRAITEQETVVIDHNTVSNADGDAIRRQFRVINAVIIPVIVRSKTHGLLVVGNRLSDYVCPPEDKEVLLLLAQQISIAIENDMLIRRISKLETQDSLTGLYNKTYALERLEEEIKRAIRFQRPCSFVLLSVDRFHEYHERFGCIAAENALIKISSVLRDNISEVDKAARFGNHDFALILPEKNKRQCIEVADEVRRKVEFIFSTEDDESRRLTCTGAVTENPIDGMVARELVSKAEAVLREAIQQGGNRICYKV